MAFVWNVRMVNSAAYIAVRPVRQPNARCCRCALQLQFGEAQPDRIEVVGGKVVGHGRDGGGKALRFGYRRRPWARNP